MAEVELIIPPATTQASPADRLLRHKPVCDHWRPITEELPPVNGHEKTGLNLPRRPAAASRWVEADGMIRWAALTGLAGVTARRCGFRSGHPVGTPRGWLCRISTLVVTHSPQIHTPGPATMARPGSVQPQNEHARPGRALPNRRRWRAVGGMPSSKPFLSRARSTFTSLRMRRAAEPGSVAMHHNRCSVRT
jgi:hypothetical protein